MQGGFSIIDRTRRASGPTGRPADHGLGHALVLAVLLTLVALPAGGQTIGYSIAFGYLVEVDLEAGTGTTVVDVTSAGASDISGLAMSSDRSLWGVSHSTNDLWRFETSGATVTRIGEVDAPVGLEAGLTFDACGRLWMVSDAQLFQVDPMDASARLVADLGEDVSGLTSNGTQLIGLLRDPSSLSRIDPVTGSLTPFGNTFPFGSQAAALDFDPDGTLWAVFWRNVPFPPLFLSQIVRFDAQTGLVISDQDLVSDSLNPVFQGNLAVTPPGGVCAPEDIPIANSTGTALLVLLLASTGLLLLRKIELSPWKA